MQGQGYLALGNQEDAVPLFEKALRESESIGERYWRWQILVTLNRVATSGDPELYSMSAHWHSTAVETINYIADSIADLKLRRTFLERSEISAVFESNNNQ